MYKNERKIKSSGMVDNLGFTSIGQFQGFWEDIRKAIKVEIYIKLRENKKNKKLNKLTGYTQLSLEVKLKVNLKPNNKFISKVGHVLTRKTCAYCDGTKIFIKYKCLECCGTGITVLARTHK